ncbi:MAG: GntR family transcriptional regulator [Rhodoferax sp.]|uniref:GntR family transcriptional regulator n=1 Tax=Rhodoferax sp. TaxID=50421 RepID=UPI0026285E8C|nr:GntR family transcriptional regulator [Rhodoferax sp.]MDD2878932.1 GntR family transcriptional regulator [Rhodoferax sp.]
MSDTQQDSTYATLRQWVTVGRFLPGERLKIREVAQALGMGTMPVRAALLRLAAEGALTHSPNCGVSVPRLSKAEFDDVLQNRLLLEGEAAERGALRLSAGDKDVLRALLAVMTQALAAKDAKAYLDANEAFHMVLYRAAGSPLLLNLIETVWLKVGPLSNQLFDDNAALGVLNDAHDDLMGALDAGDAAAARRALERDLFVAGQFLRRVCQKGDGPALPMKKEKIS